MMDKTKFVYEGQKIYAFKPQPERFLAFFYERKKIIVTHGFRKKQQKMPASELAKALRIREAYVHQVKSGVARYADTTIDF